MAILADVDCWRERGWKQNLIFHLPMHSEAVNHDGKSLGSRGLTQSFHQNQDGWRLGVEKSSVMAQHDIIEHDVDVWDLV